jgi:hypothetical protein
MSYFPLPFVPSHSLCVSSHFKEIITVRVRRQPSQGFTNSQKHAGEGEALQLRAAFLDHCYRRSRRTFWYTSSFLSVNINPDITFSKKISATAA